MLHGNGPGDKGKGKGHKLPLEAPPGWHPRDAAQLEAVGFGAASHAAQIGGTVHNAGARIDGNKLKVALEVHLPRETEALAGEPIGRWRAIIPDLVRERCHQGRGCMADSMRGLLDAFGCVDVADLYEADDHGKTIAIGFSGLVPVDRWGELTAAIESLFGGELASVAVPYTAKPGDGAEQHRAFVPGREYVNVIEAMIRVDIDPDLAGDHSEGPGGETDTGKPTDTDTDTGPGTGELASGLPFMPWLRSAPAA